MRCLSLFLFMSTFYVGTCNAATYKFNFEGSSVTGWTMSGSISFNTEDVTLNSDKAIATDITNFAQPSTFVWKNPAGTTTFSSSAGDIVINHFSVKINGQNELGVWNPQISSSNFWIVDSVWNAGIVTGWDGSYFNSVQQQSSGLPPTGTWSSAELVTSVPIPTSALLFAPVLIGLIGFKRNIKKY